MNRMEGLNEKLFESSRVRKSGMELLRGLGA